MNPRITIAITTTLLCFRMIFADSLDVKVTPAGFAYYQIGQLMKTCDPGGTGGATGRPDKALDQLANFRITLAATVQNRLRIIAGTEFGFVTRSQDEGGNSVKTGVSLKEAQGIYTYGDDPKTAPLQIAVGFFPFKYNPQATNMGEYLFSYRTGAYAPYIVNDFDNCKSRLLGLRMTSVLPDFLFGSFKQDLLFTSEMAVGKGNAPEGDYSLAYLLSYKLENIVEVGSGIYFHRLIPLDGTQTTPQPPDAFVVKDIHGLPIVKNGDTLLLTMKATKLMARFSMDPKPLLPEAIASICGKHDGTIYLETAILGLKNYNGYIDSTTPYYEDIKKRWPVMLGFYLPALKLLDFISCEFEYFNWDYNMSISETPCPTTTKDEFCNQQKFRWSVYAQKTVTKGFFIRGLVGKDHFRTVDAGGGVTKDEYLRGAGSWHYNLRFFYEF